MAIKFPANAGGQTILVPASSAKAPYTYLNGLKLDALGRVVVSG